MLQRKDKGKVPFFKESVFKVAKQIFNYPNKTFHMRELTRITKFSTTAITEAINELNKYNIVTVENTDLTKNIKANLESETYRFYKLIFNLFRLQRSGFVDTLRETYRPEAIVLFGSFAKGEDIEKSDIDILILTSNKGFSATSYIEKYEKEFNRKISLHILESIQKSPAEFKNTIANGIIIYGYLKLI